MSDGLLEGVITGVRSWCRTFRFWLADVSPILFRLLTATVGAGVLFAIGRCFRVVHWPWSRRQPVITAKETVREEEQEEEEEEEEKEEEEKEEEEEEEKEEEEKEEEKEEEEEEEKEEEEEEEEKEEEEKEEEEEEEKEEEEEEEEEKEEEEEEEKEEEEEEEEEEEKEKEEEEKDEDTKEVVGKKGVEENENEDLEREEKEEERKAPHVDVGQGFYSVIEPQHKAVPEIPPDTDDSGQTNLLPHHNSDTTTEITPSSTVPTSGYAVRRRQFRTKQKSYTEAISHGIDTEPPAPQFSSVPEGDTSYATPITADTQDTVVEASKRGRTTPRKQESYMEAIQYGLHRQDRREEDTPLFEEPNLSPVKKLSGLETEI